MSDAPVKKVRPFTGRHAAILLVMFFGVVIAVNLTMARLASGSYGGEVVKNSYVASQNFNKWLGEAQRERSLGWTARAARGGGNKVVVQLGILTGKSVTNPETLVVNARHPLGLLPDRDLHFVPAGPGRFISLETLPEGRWRLRIEVTAKGVKWRQEQDIQ